MWQLQLVANGFCCAAGSHIADAESIATPQSPHNHFANPHMFFMRCLLYYQKSLDIGSPLQAIGFATALSQSAVVEFPEKSDQVDWSRLTDFKIAI
jgi:hypothetical protein